MHSNSYTLMFTVALTTVVALLLAGMFTALKSTHDANEAIYNKKEILSAVNPDAENMSDEAVFKIFDEKVKQYVLNAKGEVIEAKTNAGGVMKAEDIKMDKENKKDVEARVYPLYVYDSDEGTYYIVSVYGKGLWDAIWGSIAIKGDLNTIGGVAFNHKGETPGLGAEIKDNSAWKAQFKGKQIFDEKGEYVSIVARKGGARQDNIKHEVDGLSGATVTADGVTKMLDSGIEVYLPYLKSLKKK